jgi:hypothetical protein
MPQLSVIFCACSNEECISNGFTSGDQWLSTNPESFFYHIIVTPTQWPCSETEYYIAPTLATDSSSAYSSYISLWASPCEFGLPSFDGILQYGKPHNLKHGCYLMLIEQFLVSPSDWAPKTTLETSLRTIPNTTLFRDWLESASKDPITRLPGSTTLLVPTDDAIVDVAAIYNTTARAFIDDPAFFEILNYHIILGTPLPPTEGIAAWPTSDGFEVAVQPLDQTSGRNYFNLATSAEPVASDKGIIYVVDAFLAHGHSSKGRSSNSS